MALGVYYEDLDEEKLSDLCDAAYDMGYEHGLAGTNRQNAGDLQFDYDMGYEDGSNERFDIREREDS